MSVRTLTLLALLIALTTVATIIIQIPIPTTQGYINVGDAMVFTSALLFGIIAWALFKGRPMATVVGIASMIAGMVIGGAVMVGGYYVVEQFIMGKAAAAEVPGNLFQVLAGVMIATPVTLILRSVAPTLRSPSDR